MTAFTHVSVMPDEVLQYWAGDPRGLYIDATVGGGGHSRLLLERLPEARVIGIDQDPMALAEAARVLDRHSPRVTLRSGNFRHLNAIWPHSGAMAVAGILFDLGVSSPQLDLPERGFSYQVEAPLDMRMDPANPVTAFRLVNMKSEAEIAEALRVYGEERWASRIAQFVVKARAVEPIRTTTQLVDIVKAAIPAAARRTGGHPARRTFQALRIWVNDELGALEEGLEEGYRALAPGGRMVVLSFHSLEDRIVKHRFREWAAQGRGRLLTRHPLEASAEEREANPRARSAKLRAFQRE